MANIKFSDFTVGNTEGDIDFVVGYKGANNIQISPTNLLASALGNYLPLAGGTMTGSIILNDDVRLLAGTGSDFSFFHDGSNSKINNNTGNIVIENFQDDGDIIFKSDDGSGGTTEYFRVDGGLTKVVVNKSFTFEDNIQAQFGSSADLQISHNGTNTDINNFTGHLNIVNAADDSDIIFYADDGSGGNAEYFRVDGGTTSIVVSASLGMYFNDGIAARFGTGGDLITYHDGSNSYITNAVGNLTITNGADDADIIFSNDDGSGGTGVYFLLDGSLADGSNKFTRFLDRSRVCFGDAADLQIYHDGTTSNIQNSTGNLSIINHADDGDIKFFSDDGSGGVAEYFRLDGSLASGGTVYTVFPDNSIATFGSGYDLQIFHDASNSYITNAVGSLEIRNNQNSGDINFRCDNGNGGLTTYFAMDGGLVKNRFYKNAYFTDNVKAEFGSSSDLQIYHNGTNSIIENITGDLIIQNNLDDKDIIFKSDDGSGGIAEYFRLDGSSKRLDIADSIPLCFGAGDDLQIQHNGSTSYIQNFTGNLIIENNLDDGDIIFKSDDGSGGTAQYFRVDGGAVETRFLKSTLHFDNVKAKFGDGDDLQIYHSGNHSYIQETGTGVLKILGSGITMQNAVGSENMAVFTENDAVILYNNGVEKLRTIGSGVRITGVSEYADNTAALAGGLTTGDVYRTGDLLKIVH